MIRLAAFAVAIAALAAPAGATVLYKSVDANGVVQFSDLPPDRGIEAKKIVVGDSTSAGPAAMRPANSLPAPTASQDVALLADEAVQRAAMQVDLAEHALAVARRPLWDVADPMQLKPATISLADRERLDFYRKNLKIAQQQLADVLSSRRRAEVTMTAEAGAPIYGPPGSPIYRR